MWSTGSAHIKQQYCLPQIQLPRQHLSAFGLMAHLKREDGVLLWFARYAQPNFPFTEVSHRCCYNCGLNTNWPLSAVCNHPIRISKSPFGTYFYYIFACKKKEDIIASASMKKLSNIWHHRNEVGSIQTVRLTVNKTARIFSFWNGGRITAAPLSIFFLMLYSIQRQTRGWQGRTFEEGQVLTSDLVIELPPSKFSRNSFSQNLLFHTRVHFTIFIYFSKWWFFECIYRVIFANWNVNSAIRLMAWFMSPNQVWSSPPSPLPHSYSACSGHLIPKWAWQLASALKYIHSLGVLHRDLKPTNVFFTTEVCL